MIEPEDSQSVIYPRLPFDGTEEPAWMYADRRQMQEIITSVYLGPYASAAKNRLEALKAAGITHVVCIRHVMESNIIKPNFPTEFTYKVLDIADSVEQNIIQFLPQTRAFIDEALQSQGKVLIHGNAGISRSAAIVIGYVMEKFGVGYKEAFHFVQQKRFCISPNIHFENQLTEYEPIFRARHSFPQPLPQLAPGQSSMEVTNLNFKRKIEDVDQEDENSR